MCDPYLFLIYWRMIPLLLLFESMFSPRHKASLYMASSDGLYPDESYSPDEECEAVHSEDTWDEETGVPHSYYTRGDLDDIFPFHGSLPEEEEDEIFASDEEEEILPILQNEEDDCNDMVWKEDEEP